MTRLACLTALWRRPELARLMLKETRPLFDVALAVGSEGDASRLLAEECGWEYLEFSNQPVSTKWDAGMQALRGRADSVLCVGSDDFVSPALVLAAREAMKTTSYYGFLDFYFVGHGPQAHYTPGYVNHRAGETIGAARTFSKQLLDRVDWAPWPPGLARGLDYGLIQVIKPALIDLPKPKAVRLADIGGMAFDAKCADNLNPLSVCLGGTREVDVQEVFKHFRPGLLEELTPLLTPELPHLPTPAVIRPSRPGRRASPVHSAALQRLQRRLPHRGVPPRPR